MKIFDRCTQPLKLASLLMSVFFIGAFVFVALSTLHYPFNLEWMEGQSIDVIQRVIDGQPIYVEPSIDYVPFLYTPLYFYVSAFVAKLTSVDFFAARLVSLLATLITGFVIYFWARKEGGSKWISLVAAGLFFSTYELSGRWFDVGRIDSLYVCFLITGLYVFYFYRGWRWAACAALLLTAATMTKQSAVMALAPALLMAFFVDRRHALQTIVIFAALVIAIVLVYNAASDGWFWFYIYRVLAGHGYDRPNFMLFWKDSMARDIGLLLAVCASALPLMWRKQPRHTLLYLAMAAGIIGSTYAARIHWGTYLNVLMPMHALVTLAAGVALIKAEKMQWRWLRTLMWGAVTAQMALSLYYPGRLIPDEKSIEIGNKFIAQLAEIEGDVFMPELQYVVKRAGKKSYTLGMAAFDIYRSNLGEKNFIRDKFTREIYEAIYSDRFSAFMPGTFLSIRRFDEKRFFQNYRLYKKLEYPREYVTGAVNLTKTVIFIRIPEEERRE